MVEQVKTKTEPHVRFRGFDDEWEQVKLGDFANFSKGKGFSKKDLSFAGSPIILYGQMYTDYRTVIDSVGTFTDSSTDSCVLSDVNDVIVPASGETPEDISRASVVCESNIILGSDLNVIKPHNTLNSIFLALTISNGTQQRELIKRAQGKTVAHLRNSDLKKVSVSLPSLDEQQKIGELFQTLDKSIDLSNTHVENLKQQKKALLQRLFPQKGETGPKVRLRGFTDAWNEVKLGDVLSIPDKEKVDVQSADELMTLRLHLGGLYSGSNRTLSIGSTPYYRRHSGQFIYGRQNIFNGSMAIISDEFDGLCTSNFVPSLDIDYTMIDGSFLYQYVSRKSWYTRLEAYTTGTGSKLMHERELFKLSISIPSLEEQQKIGELFQTVDEQIRLAEDKVSQYKELKQALLQRLFV